MRGSAVCIVWALIRRAACSSICPLLISCDYFSGSVCRFGVPAALLPCAMTLSFRCRKVESSMPTNFIFVIAQVVRVLFRRLRSGDPGASLCPLRYSPVLLRATMRPRLMIALLARAVPFLLDTLHVSDPDHTDALIQVSSSCFLLIFPGVCFRDLELCR